MKSGRHFLQIPGPSNIPDRILRAIDRPIIDHRGPDFSTLIGSILERLQELFRCTGPVILYPSSGSGAWEAALVNALSPGDRVLMYETGHFSTQWYNIALRLGLEADFIAGDWRRSAEPDAIEKKLTGDDRHSIKAVIVVHNETSTGAVSDIAGIRNAIDSAGHPTLLIVDAVSSLGSMDYRHDEWGVDVTVCGSQKGLMLPPGLGFNAVSDKALEAAGRNGFPQSYWNWESVITANKKGFFPYTPPTNLLFGLDEALAMLFEEGIDNVIKRHNRLAEAARQTVRAWGFEMQCVNPSELANTLTAVRLPDGHDADKLRKIILDRFDMSLGTGLGKVKGKLFRIGHLGYFNDLMLAGTLCGIEMGLRISDIPHSSGGVNAALVMLAQK
jgi:alanine-glyoxylate transaminase/serine-glyoxylate transaminase/serine-pyruvate transaminase